MVEVILEMGITLVGDALKEANLTASQIDHTLLVVGGSTRIPRFRSILTEYFDKKPRQNEKIEPEKAIVIGAALKGAIESWDDYSPCSCYRQEPRKTAQMNIGTNLSLFGLNRI
jgi:molecular chaperone DnaK (HSP70)